MFEGFRRGTATDPPVSVGSCVVLWWSLGKVKQHPSPTQGLSSLGCTPSISTGPSRSVCLARAQKDSLNALVGEPALIGVTVTDDTWLSLLPLL